MIAALVLHCKRLLCRRADRRSRCLLAAKAPISDRRHYSAAQLPAAKARVAPSTQLRSSMAMVMGPTPPGTGVMHSARSAACRAGEQGGEGGSRAGEAGSKGGARLRLKRVGSRGAAATTGQRECSGRAASKCASHPSHRMQQRLRIRPGPTCAKLTSPTRR